MLAETGQLQIDTLICQPGGVEFQRADSLIELSGKLASEDPWSAWAEMESAGEDWAPEEDDDEEDDLEVDTQIMTALEEPKPTRTLSAPPVIAPELEVGDLAPIEGIEPSPPAPAKPEVSEPPGKIIAFPAERTRRQVRTDGGYALAQRPVHRLPPPPLPDLPRPSPRPVRTTTQLSIMRLSMLVLAGVLLLLLGRAYVLDTAATILPPHPATLAEVETSEGEAPEAAPDPYALLESELRGQMSLDLLSVTSEGEFEEALLIELGRVKLDVASVRVAVEDWAGRKRDVPQAADFQIRLRFRSGELDRELAAVGLVVGKYIQRYSLDVSRFDVVMEHSEGGFYRYRINSEAARKFYIQRIDLVGYLEALQQ